MGSAVDMFSTLRVSVLWLIKEVKGKYALHPILLLPVAAPASKIWEWQEGGRQFRAGGKMKKMCFYAEIVKFGLI